MKRLLLTTLILSTALSCASIPAQAGFIADQKAKIEFKRELKNEQNKLEKLIQTQIKYSNSHDLKGLSSLYTSDFMNNDGYNKDLYMDLVQDTWDTYSDITYNAFIEEMDINNNFATITTRENAVATVANEEDMFGAVGELHSNGKCIYYLVKVGENWKIRSEQILEEKTTLKYGDARYTDIDLISPNQVPAGNEYSVSLKVDLPKEAIVIASIGKERMVHPQVKCDEVFRKLPEDQVLERVFKANTENLNEYAVASVGITRSEQQSENMFRVYMSGLAIVMTRVNIIPKNNFIKLEEKDAEKI